MIKVNQNNPAIYSVKFCFRLTTLLVCAENEPIPTDKQPIVHRSALLEFYLKDFHLKHNSIFWTTDHAVGREVESPEC